jgi:hypothetical protein
MTTLRNFEVYLVNANQTKNLPGRKNNDVPESQWRMKLRT